VITDPPYGVNKAEWDNEFPTEWYRYARMIANTIYIMVGVSTIPKCLNMCMEDYQDMVAIWLSNGMTRGPLGFGNWIPVIVCQKDRTYLGGQNAYKAVVDIREKINHPTPKPLHAMKKLIAGTKHDVVLDPFMGSGTTGVACVQLGRKFIGIELDPQYFEIAKKRIQ